MLAVDGTEHCGPLHASAAEAEEDSQRLHAALAQGLQAMRQMMCDIEIETFAQNYQVPWA